MCVSCRAVHGFQAYLTDKKKSFLPVEFMAEIARLLETLMCLIFSCLEQEKVGQRKCSGIGSYFVEIVNSLMENVIKKQLKQKEWLCEIAKFPLGENKS